MAAHNWGLENLMKDGLWEFVCVQTPELHDILQAVTPVNQHCVIISHSANPFNALKRDILEKVKVGCWTVFDSLSYLLLEFSSKDIFNLVIYLSTIAMVYGGVHFLILHEGVHDDKWLNALSLISDGVMGFKISETGRGVEGMIQIRKMSKIYRSRSVPFTINERGFVIETTVRIA
jgi:archaellum biogenesis ATPase FlaH